MEFLFKHCICHAFTLEAQLRPENKQQSLLLQKLFPRPKVTQNALSFSSKTTICIPLHYFTEKKDFEHHFRQKKWKCLALQHVLGIHFMYRRQPVLCHTVLLIAEMKDFTLKTRRNPSS
ncbi:hypothetical protein TNCT_464451 [Trichonephila clavata]|uniref:Uncharacterized protein n=1 Tax=Trichonephila clavata TaxID=2740835 RepID=A0A8X6LFQ3_TRICU|nr:hypothetical protein TNCT_464451 [Trichonephila clavata]